jgi:DNA primase
MGKAVAMDAKEQIRQAVDLVEVAGSYLPLRRQGKNFIALCPWHDDSRPSLQINPERQSFKCWVCDVGGDVFSFVMRIEGVDFREALEMLAERAGITLRSATQPAAGQQLAGGPGDKRALYAAMAWAEERFHHCLLESPEAQPARDYLTLRKITRELVDRFRVGFAPNRWDWLVGQSQNSEWTQAVLERVGLVIRRQQSDRYYDRFRGRLMFPIRDIRSRPIAFGGRVLPQLADENSGGKYINSPETPLFSKNREFYGLDRARDAIREEKHIIVMEGYTDCLMAHQHGIENAIAVLGTALGERHLPILQRYAASITLVLDGDEAGQRRTNEVLELFVAQQIDLKILTLPQGGDPCDFIVTQGGGAFRQLISQSVDALEHKLRIESKGLDVQTDTHGTTQAAERVLGTLARARPGAGLASSSMLLREQQMLSRTARHFQLPEANLRRRLAELRQSHSRRRLVATAKSSNVSTTPPSQLSPAAWPQWERELLELILLDAQNLAVLAREIEAVTVSTSIARRLYEQCLQLWQSHNAPLYEKLMVCIEDPEEKRVLVTLDEESRAKASSDMSLRLRDLIAAHKEQQQATGSGGPPVADNADEELAQFVNQARPEHRSKYERRKK